MLEDANGRKEAHRGGMERSNRVFILEYSP
jgi:hypothetical protein